jgi:DNA repair exonuclease SbcCD nuclease subunit
MAIKLLHTGDLHLDAPFLILGEKGWELRQQLLNTLDKITALAIDEKIDLLLIAGDLFDSNNPSYTTIDRVVDAFKNLERSGIPICLVPGSHDCYNSQSIYRLYNFREAVSNLTVFTNKITQKIFEDLDLTVYGRAVTGGDRRKNPLQNLTPAPNTNFHVAVVHGILDALQDRAEEKANFTADEIKKSGMNYIALGHWHSFASYSQNNVKAFYCGSPEMLEAGQKNSGYVAIVTIHPSREVEVQPKRVGRCHFKTEEILVDGITDVNQIINTIKSKAHPHQFFEARLKGLCSFDLQIDTEEIEQELEPRFLKLRVIDETHLDLQEIPIGELPENTVIGQFVHIMRDEINKSTGEERELAEDVLKLGVSLLRGKRVF